ncbi:MAG: 30S ribosomal protein S2 [Phycisphaerae bacterium]|nr:30S ribosomal protein S2 [Phycisphaerae bacterium]
MIDCGVHFGHRAGRWNPKMSPYIFGKRNSIHIFDIRETVKGLLRAKKFLAALVSQGHDVLIVGTKRQARDIVEKQARRVGMHYVNERWLGGTLTNFQTIRSRLARLEELENLEKTGEIDSFSKKMKSTFDRERRKIKRNLDGIRRMSRLPGALVVVDVRREYIAVREAGKLGIPTVCLVDTDSDPDGVSIVIPGNDDAMRAIELMMTQLADAMEEGKRGRIAAAKASADQAGPGRPRRSRRLTTSELAERGAAEQEAASDSRSPTSDQEPAPAVASQTPDAVASQASGAPPTEVSDSA